MPQFTVRLPWLLAGVVLLLSACVSTPTTPPARHRLAAVPDHAASVPQAEQRANAQQFHPTGARSSPPYRLAVVPWNTTGRDVITHHQGLDALKHALAGSAFVPVFSAYDLPNDQTTLLSQNEHALRRQVWHWRQPNQGPRPEAVWQLGTELGVDAILAYGMDPRPGTDYLWVYLFDIPYKQIYSLEGTTYWYETETAGTLTGMTQTLFGAFKDFRMQKSPKESGTRSR